MSEKDIRAMLAFASGFCERAFAKRGEIASMWHAVTSSGEDLYQSHPQGLDKDSAMAIIRALFELRDVVRYVHMGEAWTLDRLIQPEEFLRLDREGLRNEPDRVEVVMLQAEDADYGLLSAHRKIIRPPGRKPYLAPLEMLVDLAHVPSGATIQSYGRMVGLLPVKGTKQ